MQELQFNNIVVQPVFEDLGFERKITISVLRLDLIHPVISGNKWFKLKYYIEEAKKKNKKKIIPFGGAWSNHIVAMACASSLNNFQSIAIIRGEEPAEYSATLKAAKQYGMELIFTNRQDYRDKNIPPGILTSDAYIIPEGGYGKPGAEGFSTALAYCNKNSFTHFISAVGTGTMMAGVIKAVSGRQQVIGVPVLKNNYDQLPAIERLLTLEERSRDYRLIKEYHFGGYAKYTPELTGFMNSFYKESRIPTDFVYTGKLFFAIKDLIRKNYFSVDSNILVIHSGGLQGNTSLTEGTLIF
jgi:1-aminocyclopropane-1-carboxylate deaminase